MSEDVANAPLDPVTAGRLPPGDDVESLPTWAVTGLGNWIANTVGLRKSVGNLRSGVKSTQSIIEFPSSSSTAKKPKTPTKLPRRAHKGPPSSSSSSSSSTSWYTTTTTESEADHNNRIASEDRRYRRESADPRFRHETADPKHRKQSANPKVRQKSADPKVRQESSRRPVLRRRKTGSSQRQTSSRKKHVGKKTPTLDEYARKP